MTLHRALLQQKLADATRRVAEGRERLARQSELVAELARDGVDTALAEGLLDTFAVTQRTHEDFLRHVEGELRTARRAPWRMN